MTKKPSSPKAKPWRGAEFMDQGENGTFFRRVYEPISSGNTTDCTVIPDGCPIPLPAHVQRLVTTALNVSLNRDACSYAVMSMLMDRLDDAAKKYKEAEARRKAKRK